MNADAWQAIGLFRLAVAELELARKLLERANRHLAALDDEAPRGGSR